MTPEIKKILPGLKTNIELKKHTTFKIGGPAKYFFIAKTKEGLIKAIKTAKEFNLPFFILGGGSNLLVSDKGYKGLVIKTGKPLFSYISKGLEWAVGIPGTIEGAVYGNAGVFEKSMKDAVESVEVLDAETGKIKVFKNRDCQFTYRDSIFKRNKNLIILSVKIKPKKSNPKKIKEYLNYKKETQPLNFPSAGCAFKNPKLTSKNQKLLRKFPEFKKLIREGMIPAAFLIEKCGLKGKKTGRAEFSKKHANFIVNLGGVHPHTKRTPRLAQKNKICVRCGVGARAKDVLKLMKLAKQKVKNKFGIDLQEEIQVVK